MQQRQRSGVRWSSSSLPTSPVLIRRSTGEMHQKVYTTELRVARWGLDLRTVPLLNSDLTDKLGLRSHSSVRPVRARGGEVAGAGQETITQCVCDGRA